MPDLCLVKETAVVEDRTRQDCMAYFAWKKIKWWFFFFPLNPNS